MVIIARYYKQDSLYIMQAQRKINKIFNIKLSDALRYFIAISSISDFRKIMAREPFI